jgi:hypothetical protein
VPSEPDVCSCPAAVQERAAGLPAPGPPRADVAELIPHLYVCLGWSTYRIGRLTGVDRQRVTRLLKRSGVAVKARGAGRPRVRDARQAELDNLMASLYVGSGLTSVRISALTGVPERTVRDRLRTAGVRMRTRGRLNREDRTQVPAVILTGLYVSAGLSAAEVGKLAGVSRQVVLRAVHDEKLPVRVGGPEPRHGPTEIELIEALYADPLVHRTLSRFGITNQPAAGPIWERFPDPVPLTAPLVEDLYVRCGLSARHIELLTGQPSQNVLRLLQAHGIARRPAGGRAPFLLRWRTDYHEGASGPDDTDRLSPLGPA